MSDIGLIWDPAKMQGDIALTGGDLFLDNPLRTAVMVSLFSDRLAPDQVSALDKAVGIQPPGTAATSELSPRRGWWGDAIRNITGGSPRGRANQAPLCGPGLYAGDQNGAVRIDSSNENNTFNGRGDAQQWWYNWDFDASLVVPTASENRPRNIAFNFIVRAA